MGRFSNSAIGASAAIALIVTAGFTVAVQRADVATAAPASVAPAPAPSPPSPPVDSVGMGDYPAPDYAEEAKSLPPALTTALDRDLGITPSEYLAQAAAASDAVGVVRTLADSGVEMTGSRLDGTTLVVNVASAKDASAVEALGAVADLGSPALVDTSSLQFSPAFDVTGGEGYTWSTGAGSYQCSIGFPGFRISDGQPMAVTAGHCTSGMAGISGGVKELLQQVPGATGTRGQVLGSPLAGASAFGGGYDGGLITLDGAGATPTASVLTWGGGAAAPRASAPLAITGMSPTIAGATLCKSGSRTGWTCGTVLGVDYPLNVGGNTVNSIIATTCLQPGDSGGAAVVGQLAVGINSSTSSLACGSSGYIAGFYPMISAGGRASVQAQFGSVWEPAFSVSPATLGSLTVAPDTMSMMAVNGTVATASAQSRVAVYADSATVALATVDASSGSFDVPSSSLISAGLSPGDHILHVVVLAGTRSRAAAVDVAVSVSGGQIVSALLPSVAVSR